MSSYNKNEWSTPGWFFDQSNSIFQFNIDVCAHPWNAKCERYFTPEQDTLKQTLGPADKGWMNPPYGRGMLEKFLGWANRQAENGALIVGPIPDERSADWYWNQIANRRNVITMPVPQRLAFDPPVGYEGETSGPSKGTVLVIFFPTNFLIRP